MLNTAHTMAVAVAVLTALIRGEKFAQSLSRWHGATDDTTVGGDVVTITIGTATVPAFRIGAASHGPVYYDLQTFH